MRRSVLLLCAAVPLLFAPPALADDGHDGHAEKAESVCRPPDVDHSYRTDALAVHVKLPASGCASREHSLFYLSAGISRTDVFGPQESVSHAVRCGPFMSAEDRKRLDLAPGEYFCNVDVALDHQPVDESVYEVEIVYPGATDERILTSVSSARRTATQPSATRPRSPGLRFTASKGASHAQARQSRRGLPALLRPIRFRQ